MENEANGAMPQADGDSGLKTIRYTASAIGISAGSTFTVTSPEIDWRFAKTVSEQDVEYHMGAMLNDLFVILDAILPNKTQHVAVKRQVIEKVEKAYHGLRRIAMPAEMDENGHHLIARPWR